MGDAEVEIKEPGPSWGREKLDALIEFFREIRERLPWIASTRRVRIIFGYAGIIFFVGAAFWLLSAHSAYSLIVRGSVITFILVLISVYVAVAHRRSLVEERLGRFLEDEVPAPEQDASGSIMTEWLNRRVAKSSLGDRIARELARGDLKFKVAEYYALVFMSTAVMVLVAYLIQPNAVSAIIGAGIGFFLPRFYVRRQQAVRLNKFNDQISDMLNLVVNGLRTGYSTMQAMEAVSRELSAPISDEFHRVIQEMQIGIPMEKALDDLLRRIPSDDLDFVITAHNIQRETGGNLSEILDHVRSRTWDRKRLITEGRKVH